MLNRAIPHPVDGSEAEDDGALTRSMNEVWQGRQSTDVRERLMDVKPAVTQ